MRIAGPCAVDAVVAMKLSFYTSTRTFPSPFKPVLAVETLQTSQASDTNGHGVQPRLVRLADKTVLLEFPSAAGKWYRVRYSPDMVHWFDCPVPLQAGNSKMQWVTAARHSRMFLRPTRRAASTSSTKSPLPETAFPLT